ncbi:hypothetical protein QVD17_17722 [Tagetes erecta]|uniref:Uncharacterized protein n=1 Tax=Tagetes erecta TaxID=13708 RepID=A0AAD8P1Q7_TARER|nr:hypothetical protein QVD17_17722 [Tagetes erecta]
MFNMTSPYELKGSVSDKQAKIHAILTLEGLEASELKTLLPVVQQHINSSLVELSKVVHKHLDANGVKGLDEGVLVGTHTEVVVEGFNDSETRSLRRFVEQRWNLPGYYEMPKDTANVTHHWSGFFKKMF